MKTTKTLKKTLTFSLLLATLVCLVGMTAPPANAGVRVGVGIRVGAPPPPLRHEVVVVRPGPDYVWIPGFWEWRHNDYAWVGGRWSRPPHRGAVWVAPRHELRGRHHFWVRGYWR